MDGTTSEDDGTIISYIWNQIAGPSVNVNGADTTTPTFTASSNNISSTANAVLVFQLTVADDKNATSISAVKITVKHTNRSPIANAGTNQTVNVEDVATLDGSKSKIRTMIQ